MLLNYRDVMSLLLLVRSAVTGPGYSKDEAIAQLQMKLSLMLEAKRRAAGEDFVEPTSLFASTQTDPRLPDLAFMMNRIRESMLQVLDGKTKASSVGVQPNQESMGQLAELTVLITTNEVFREVVMPALNEKFNSGAGYAPPEREEMVENRSITSVNVPTLAEAIDRMRHSVAMLSAVFLASAEEDGPWMVDNPSGSGPRCFNATAFIEAKMKPAGIDNFKRLMVRIAADAMMLIMAAKKEDEPT